MKLKTWRYRPTWWNISTRLPFSVMGEYNDIEIMDGYWITLARPDNRQIGLVSNRGKHLVHPGEEVLRAMVRNWIHVLLEHVAMQATN